MIYTIKNTFCTFGLAAVAVLILNACQPAQSNNGAWTSAEYRKAASALLGRELHQEAADLYQRYLHASVIPANDIPKVLYQLGIIYLEHLRMPEKALGYFTVLQALHPDQTFNNQLGKKIVACLELSGRRTDAKQALTHLTEISPVNRDTAGGGRVVAQVDGQDITLNEIEQTMGAIPENPLEQNQVISQYVSQILIAEAARRKGLADKPEVRKRMHFVQNQVLAQENLREELKLAPPSENDLKYYFEANKTHFWKGADSLKPLGDLQKKVLQRWSMEKQNEKYQAYVKELLASDRVKIYGAGGR